MDRFKMVPFLQRSQKRCAQNPTDQSHAVVLLLSRYPNDTVNETDDRSTYRPISVLPVVARLFEKLIYEQLYPYLNENNLPFSGQSRFRSHHSVLTSLLHCTNDW